MGRQVMQFQVDSLEFIDALDMFLRTCWKLCLITEDTDEKSWKLAYDRFEKNYKGKR